MSRQIFRFLTVISLGISLASTAVATLFSFLILVDALAQICVENYRHAHPELVLDTIGLPIMSGCLAFFLKTIISRVGSAEITNASNGWVELHDKMHIAFALVVLAGANLALAVFVCNRYAAIWSYCHVVVSSG
jgi:hypothetical protein